MNQYKIINSIGVYDIYKHIRKNKWQDIGEIVTEKDYYTIIRGVNDLLVENLIKGKTIKLPHRLGEIQLRKSPKQIKFKNNKLITNLPINWLATKQLWEQDESSKNTKRLVRYNVDYIYSIEWNKSTALFTNKTFYNFRPMRSLKKKLGQILQNNNIDTSLKYEYQKQLE